MQACSQMFKDLEESEKAAGASGNAAGGQNDQMMNILNMFMKEMGADGAGQGGSGNAGGPEGGAMNMDKLMTEFSSFLKESEGDESMKGALDSIVNELLSKDTLYEPIKTLRDEFPPWLEENWQKISQKDLEM